MKLKIYQIDAFTSELFKGNSAAVIILSEFLSKELMQKIAFENNLSETAFLVRTSSLVYEIRWFSPLCEVDFCGHATLASAHVLFEIDSSLSKITFNAKAIGDLLVCKVEKSIQMTFPNQEPTKVDVIPALLLDGLNLKPIEVLINRQAYFAIYENESDINKIETNSSLLKQLYPYDVVVSSKADTSSKYDFVSRYFWPANGGVEDPVTGSIHTGLAPFWAKKLDKNKLIAYQASKRGGVLNCEVKEDKVIISGESIKYLEGYIEI